MFSVLSEQHLLQLAEDAQFIRATAKQTIFEENEAARGGFILSMGRIVMKKTTFKGNFLVTELLGEGDPFGVVCAARGDAYPLTAEVLRESVVLHIPQEALVDVANTTNLSEHLISICKSRFQHALSTIAQLADASSRVRVARALVLLADKFSETPQSSIDVTRDEVARIAGVTVETCIRVTRQLEKEEILTFPENRRINILSPKALRGICDIS